VAKVTMPQLGESVAEGTIGKWLKQPGDSVEKYEPLLEVITDKVNAEVPSPFAGVLKEILAEEGATVPNNAEIAVIETTEEAGGAAPEAAAAEQPAPKAEGAAAGPAGSDETTPEPAPAPEPAPEPAPAPERAAAAAAPAAPTATAAAPPATGDADARMSPAVRRLLREHELTAAQITGTGQGGRITRDDVLAVVEHMRNGGAAPAAASAAPAPASAPAAAPPAPAQPAAAPSGNRAGTPSSPPAPTKSSCR